MTCKGKFDAPPGTPLPKDAPPECEKFRQQPDAIEYAARLDEKYGRNFDAKEMPLYCVPMSFKAVYDTTDMRSTGGGDVKYAMDAAPKDSTLMSRLRAAGAIIYAHAHNSEYNGGSGDPGGDCESGASLHRRRRLARNLGRHDLQSLRHRTRHSGLERRLRRVGSGQPGRVLDLRNHRRFLPRSG